MPVMLRKYDKLFRIVALFTLACLLLNLSRYLYTGSMRHWYLPWNLFLAFLPLLFALVADATKKKSRFWLFFVLWLAFVPNAYYIVTDLIHLNPTEASLEGFQAGSYRYSNDPNSPGILFDVALLFMYSAFGFLLGLMSTDIMHRKLRSFVSANTAWLLVFTSLFLSGFAIYLGRFLRWNSWDLLTNIPALFADIGTIVWHPLANAEAWAITLLFFYLSSSFYLLYRSLRSL